MTKGQESRKVDYELFKEFGDFQDEVFGKLKFLIAAVRVVDKSADSGWGMNIMEDLIADVEKTNDAIWEKAEQQAGIGGADNEN